MRPHWETRRGQRTVLRAHRGPENQNGLYLVSFELDMDNLQKGAGVGLHQKEEEPARPLTRNPPLGLVSSVVPMVMFSLTSCKLGMVVFSKKNTEKYTA